jgi:hypothetical protein
VYKQLHSIEQISRVFPTGTNPVLVHCSNYKDYVCKHDASKRRLFNELLCANLLKIWKIPFPSWAIVTVKDEHIGATVRNQHVQASNFKTPCFGTEYLQHAQELTRLLPLMLQTNSLRKKLVNPIDFLKIGLFDLWLGNDDRNLNNFNLLLHPRSGGFEFIPIDHSDIFNTNSLHHGLNQLTETDSILLAGFTSDLVSLNRDARRAVLDRLVKMFYICVYECAQQLDNFILQTPGEWDLPLAELVDQLKQSGLTEKKWLDETTNTFKRYIQLAYA